MGNFCRVELVGVSQSIQGVLGCHKRCDLPALVRPSLGPGPKDKSWWNSKTLDRIVPTIGW